MGFLAFLIFVLLLLHLQLRGKVDRLEQKYGQQLQRLQNTSTDKQATSPPPPTSQPNNEVTSFAERIHATEQPPTPHHDPADIQNSETQDYRTDQTPPPTNQQIHTTPEPQKPNFIYTWFQEQTLIKLGAIFFFLGIAWFLGYAINEGWIHPALRIILAVVVGIVIAGIGHLRQHIAKTQYLTLTALGSAICVASIAAGQFTLQLLNPYIALILLVTGIGYALFVAVRTNTEWLASSATVATLVAPLLTNSQDPNPSALLLFLLIATVALLSVVAVTKWRTITLILSFGIATYLIPIHQAGSLNDLTVWIFVLLFAGVLFGATSISILKTREATLLDIISFCIVGFWYLTFAHQLAFSPGIATLVAAFAFAVCGYIAQDRQLPSNVVATFAVFSMTGLLFATALIFSGVTLVLVFTVEITAAIILASLLRFSDKVLITLSCLFILPVSLSLPYLDSSSWSQGIFHTAAVTILAVWIGLLVSSYWVTHYYRSTTNSINHPLLISILTVSYFYGVFTAFSYGKGLGAYFNSPGIISTYVLLLIITLGLTAYLLVQKSPTGWVTAILTTIGLPLLLSLESLEAPFWRENGILHTHALGVTILLGIFALILTLLVVAYRETRHEYYKTAAMAVSGVGIFYFLFVVFAFWSGVFKESASLAYVATYTTYAVIAYILITTAAKTYSSPAFIRGVAATGILPLLMSLPSFSTASWNSSALHPDAAGLYVITTLTILSGMTIYRYSNQHNLTELRSLYRVIFSAAGFMAVGVTWVMMGAITPTEAGGVTAALFIYTVAGLTLYLIGRAKEQDELRYAGIALIALVTIRLLLVDIWVMEVFWRIITFLGIGALFIAAALLEKQNKVNEDSEPTAD